MPNVAVRKQTTVETNGKKTTGGAAKAAVVNKKVPFKPVWDVINKLNEFYKLFILFYSNCLLLCF